MANFETELEKANQLIADMAGELESALKRAEAAEAETVRLWAQINQMTEERGRLNQLLHEKGLMDND